MATSSWLVVFVFSVIVYSISNHFVYAHGPMHVYDKIRNIAHRIHPNLGELFECMICFPTWVGMALSAMNYFFLNGVALTPFMILLNGIAPWWIIIALDGFFGSAVGWLIDTFQSAVERSNQANG